LGGTAPGAGNYTFEFFTDGTQGLPVFSLDATQAGGTGETWREMVAAEEVGGEWQRATDPGSGEPLSISARINLPGHGFS
jgi:hypothetical protein